MATDGSGLIGEWKVTEESGIGRVGRTFAVFRDKSPDQSFILKLQRNDQPGIDPNTNEKEAKLLRAGLEKVPERLPDLIEVGICDGVHFFVMELLPCIDYPIREKDYRSFCVNVFTALADLHRAGILHNDLTPAHIRLKRGKIAFIDLDNACLIRDAPKNRDCIGTDPYIAPELATRGEVSERSDMFAAATILLERCPEKLYGCFEPVLRDCLRREPGDRPPYALLVAERLRTCHAPHHRFGTLVRWSSVVVTVVAIGVTFLALRSKLHRRTHLSNQQLAFARAEAEAAAGKRHFRSGTQLKLAVMHLETSLRTPGFADKEVYEMLAKCYGQGLGVDTDLKKSHAYDQLAKGLLPRP